MKEVVRGFDPAVWERISGKRDGSSESYSDLARKEAENKALKEEITRLKIELEKAKRPTDGSDSDSVMHAVVDTLLHQAKSLSTLVFLHEQNGPSATR
ncbi:MAG: hypothetical protein ACYC7J_04905 [Syntrophales bacterium]